MWMNPPFSRMQEVVDKLARDRARAVVVAPAWTYTDWWTKLENISTDYLNLQHPEGVFLRGGRDKLKNPRWHVL